LGEPEHAVAVYAEENVRRGALIREYQDFIGNLSPFLEIGANAGHTSYMLVNDFGAEGFALDLSADSLRYGTALQELWGLSRAPVRVAGDALKLPFRDGSLRLVLACQMLSQFMNIESVVVEVKRVLAPGGVFLFVEEPLRRLLSLRLYRCPYRNRMKPWERTLDDWGLLGYLVKDVIGAEQEESFGIRQNHSMYLRDWHRLIEKHFAAHLYSVFVRDQGWAQRCVRNMAVRLDPHRSLWRAAHLLGGTLAAACRKEGAPPETTRGMERFESLLRCPDCAGYFIRRGQDLLVCTRCRFAAAEEGGVYNLLPSKDRAALYPGDREDIIDFSLPGHETHLAEGWYDVEGVYGNKYRWMGPRAAARLKRLEAGPQRLRVRGFAHEQAFARRQPVKISVTANGRPLRAMTLHRSGLFIYEADLPEAGEYRLDLSASPAWSTAEDDRALTLIISLIRLVPR
jgi:SAM-dependent methyltransferase